MRASWLACVCASTAAFFAVLFAVLFASVTPVAADHVHPAPPPKPEPLAEGEETATKAEAKADRYDGIEVLSVIGQTPHRPAESWIDIRVENRPMGDGAEVLRKLPGFAVVRQGGIGSDPVLRGLGGSRLGVVIDGMPYAGACNHGMDPATTYVDPGSFSELLVLHGPQSVRHPAAISGAVEFKRSEVEFDELGAKLRASALTGSFGQWEFSGDGAVGFEHGYARGSGSWMKSDDYRDGDGEAVFSRYERWNGRAALGWTPDEDTLLEASAEFSDGEMANPTIHMDATQLDRRTYGARFEKNTISTLVDKVEARFGYIDVDHVMDDYSLRPAWTPDPDGTSPFVRHDLLAMGQAWQEWNGRAAIHLLPFAESVELEIGTDVRYSDYDARAAFGSESFLRVPPATDYTLVDFTAPDLDSEAWNSIVRFTNIGLYAEARWTPRDGSRVVGGLRWDSYHTQTGEMHAAGEITNEILPGSNEDRRLDLFAGFLRYEHRFKKIPLLAAVGIGHAQRGADYWEVYSYAYGPPEEGGVPGEPGGIYLDPEKNTELDVSLYYGGDKLTAEVALFASRVDDFILTYNGIASYNVLAQRLGGEAGLAWRFFPEFVASADLAFVIAENDTESVPLAQTPPAEITLALRYEAESFALGFASRFVRWQNRIHPDHGNRIGVDTTSTPGFAVLSADASFSPFGWMDVGFGVDNLLDQKYHEHLSRITSPVPGYVSRDKINEPGRRFWLRVGIDFDV